MSLVEILGYAASVLVAASLTMSGIFKLRLINLAGAFLLAIYGVFIAAVPVAAVNGFICLVDIYYLWDIFKTKEYFRTLEVQHDSEYLTYFINFHENEIKKYMPAFRFNPTPDTEVLFILRNSIPAGLLLGEKRKDNSLFIDLDFVIPGYRDMKIGKYVYKNIFSITGTEKIFTSPGNPKHDNYLRRMGFELTELNGSPVFCLKRSEA